MIMFWKMLVGALAALFVLVALSGCEQPRPIPPGTDRAYYGHLVEGAKYGVSVGMAHEDAVATLVAQGLRDDRRYRCDVSYLKELVQCSDNDDIHFFRRQDFLKDGQVFLRIENGRVVAIFWRYSLVHIVF
ncbi:hypothetical protein [Glycocaulis sp.]|uniref:hypothetical protein n=1 Tax=Glycocaulis sp. TaxID=1969725 RepID=UPI003F6F750C